MKKIVKPYTDEITKLLTKTKNIIEQAKKEQADLTSGTQGKSPFKNPKAYENKEVLTATVSAVLDGGLSVVVDEIVRRSKPIILSRF